MSINAILFTNCFDIDNSVEKFFGNGPNLLTMNSTSFI